MATKAMKTVDSEREWLDDQIASVSSWERRLRSRILQAKAEAKELREEHAEAKAQLDGLLVKLSHRRAAPGAPDPEAEAEKESKPILKVCTDAPQTEAVETPAPVEPTAVQVAADAYHKDVLKPWADKADQGSLDWRTHLVRNVLARYEVSSPDDITERLCNAWSDIGGQGLKLPMTMDILHNWFAGGGRLNDVAGLSDEGKVGVFDALYEWFKAHAWSASSTYPEAFPIQLLTTAHHGLEAARKRVRAKRSREKKKAAAAASA